MSIRYPYPVLPIEIKVGNAKTGRVPPTEFAVSQPPIRIPDDV